MTEGRQRIGYISCAPLGAVAMLGMLTQMATAAEVPQIAAQAVLEDHYPQARVEFEDGVTGLPDLQYYSPPGFRPLTLDLYLPSRQVSSAGGRPLVVYVHGGGWSGGHSRQSGAFVDFPAVLASLAARGYVVASVNYRLSAEAKFPAPLQDVKAAIRWLHTHAGDYGIDIGRTAIWGGSAGGHLAALAATSCGVADLEPPPTVTAGAVTADTAAGVSDCVQSAAIWYGIFDFAPIAAQSAIKQTLGCDTSACAAEVVRRASPLTYLKAGGPAFLLIAGTDDRVVNPDQSRRFAQAARAQGIPVTLTLLPGVGHSFVGSTLETTRTASLAALEQTFEFFDSTVGSRKR